MHMPFFDPAPSRLERACAAHQAALRHTIASLPPSYHAPPTSFDKQILALPLAELVDATRGGKLPPTDVLRAYSRQALRAHERFNCLSDVMFEDALQGAGVRGWGGGAVDGATQDGDARERSLLGVPVSIKDTVDFAGRPTTIGYAALSSTPAPTSAAIVRLLQDAGALVFCKTTVPTGLLGLETSSALFSPNPKLKQTPTSNPYNPLFSAGASTGGGATLVSASASLIEVGTDVAGSVRLPAHFCGLYSLKPSSGRLPVTGTRSSMEGMLGIEIVVGPMGQRLEDVQGWMKGVVKMEPWGYDHSCVPMRWQDLGDWRAEGRKLKWGVMWEDGIISPTPACRRALDLVIVALKKQGHEVVDFNPPDVFEGLKVGYQLMFSDGGAQLTAPLLPGESLSGPSTALIALIRLPRLVKRVLAFLTRASDPLSAQLLEIMHEKTVLQERENVVKREEFRRQWAERWREEGLDFVLTVPMAFPALKHGDSEKTSLIAAGYTFLFSLLDYATGVLPVTHVDQEKDALPANFFPPPRPSVLSSIVSTIFSPITSLVSFFSSSSSKFKAPKAAATPAIHPSYAALSTIAKKAYTAYDAAAMHGLPLGVQVIGRRLEEEKVLQGMAIVEDALHQFGEVFERPSYVAGF